MHKCVYSSNSYLAGGWEGCQPPHEMPAESPGSGGPAEPPRGDPSPGGHQTAPTGCRSITCPLLPGQDTGVRVLGCVEILVFGTKDEPSHQSVCGGPAPRPTGSPACSLWAACPHGPTDTQTARDVDPSPRTELRCTHCSSHLAPKPRRRASDDRCSWL